jgi:hypothetical protein
VYFTDVALQMDAKHLGDEYNRTDPPKKVGMHEMHDMHEMHAAMAGTYPCGC